MTMRHTTVRSRLEFSDSESWRTYIETNVPPEERPFVIAFGLTTLYLSFYMVRNLALPFEFAEELDRLQLLEEPVRTDTLSALNARIFAHMTRLMMDVAPVDRAPVVKEESRRTIEKLIARLEKESPAFAIWCGYKRASMRTSHLPEWSDYVRALVPPGEDEDMDFIFLMGQLGEVLRQFQTQNRPIDGLMRTRICALQRESAGKRRNLAAGVLIQDLLEGIAPCASA